MEDTNRETSQSPQDQSIDARISQEAELKRDGFVFLTHSNAKNPYNIHRVTAEVLQDQGFGVKVLPEAFVRGKGKIENHVAIYVRENDIPVDSEGKRNITQHPIFRISSTPLMSALESAGIGIEDGINPISKQPYSLAAVERNLDALSQDGASVGIEKRILSSAYRQLIKGIEEISHGGSTGVRPLDQARFQKILPQLQATQIAEGLDQPLSDIEVRELVKKECSKFAAAYPEFKPMNT